MSRFWNIEFLTTQANKIRFKIIEVAWVDSEHESAWDTLSEVLEANESGSLECRSCGFLIADTEDRIILATSISLEHQNAEEQISAYITIPKQSILWTKELRRK